MKLIKSAICVLGAACISLSAFAAPNFCSSFEGNWTAVFTSPQDNHSTGITENFDIATSTSYTNQSYGPGCFFTGTINGKNLTPGESVYMKNDGMLFVTDGHSKAPSSKATAVMAMVQPNNNFTTVTGIENSKSYQNGTLTHTQ